MWEYNLVPQRLGGFVLDKAPLSSALDSIIFWRRCYFQNTSRPVSFSDQCLKFLASLIDYRLNIRSVCWVNLSG